MTFGEFTVDVIDYVPQRPPGAVDGFLAALVAVVRDGQLALLDGAHGIENKSRPLAVRCLLETIGECAAVKVKALEPTHAREDDLLFGHANVIRAICASVDRPPRSAERHESWPLRWDYLDYQRLWTFDLERDIGIPEWGVPADVAWNMRLFAGAAVRMGELHRIGVISPDAHIGNFGVDAETKRVLAMDLEEHAMVLYRAPSAARSALDLLPLIDAMEPVAWRRFKQGYVYGRGPNAKAVFELLERDCAGRPDDAARFMKTFPRKRLLSRGSSRPAG